jgi:hypothetical protein
MMFMRHDVMAWEMHAMKQRRWGCVPERIGELEELR